MRFAPTLTNMRQHPELHLVSCNLLKKLNSHFLFQGKQLLLGRMKLMCYFCRINKQNLNRLLCAYLEQR
jgi:hypothetical protein